MSKKYRLLKLCCVPTTSTTSSKAFSLFLLQQLTVLMKQTRQAVHVLKQSILLRCLWPSLNYGLAHKQHTRKKVSGFDKHFFLTQKVETLNIFFKLNFGLKSGSEARAFARLCLAQPLSVTELIIARDTISVSLCCAT